MELSERKTIKAPFSLADKDLNDFLSKQLGTSNFIIVDKTIEKEHLITVVLSPDIDTSPSHLKETIHGQDVFYTDKEICLFKNKYFEIVIGGKHVSIGSE